MLWFPAQSLGFSVHARLYRVPIWPLQTKYPNRVAHLAPLYPPRHHAKNSRHPDRRTKYAKNSLTARMHAEIGLCAEVVEPVEVQALSAYQRALKLNPFRLFHMGICSAPLSSSGSFLSIYYKLPVTLYIVLTTNKQHSAAKKTTKKHGVCLVKSIQYHSNQLQQLFDLKNKFFLGFITQFGTCCSSRRNDNIF